jgi:hypothetical protein
VQDLWKIFKLKTRTILIETWQNHDNLPIESIFQDQEMMLNLGNHNYLQFKATQPKHLRKQVS